jgi:ankyrin repeat protein
MKHLFFPFFIMIFSSFLSCQSLPSGAVLEAELHLTADTFIEKARQGDMAAIRSLLAAGIDPNVKDDEGRTALIAAAAGGQTEIVKLLLEKGAEVNARNQQGETALFVASGIGEGAEMVKELIKRGADINIETGGMTPLMNAASRRQTDIAQILIEHGADINRKNRENIGALGLAARANQMEIVNLLMVKGVAFSSEDAGEVITMASLRGRHDIIRFFMERGVSIDTFDGTGNNALIWAIGGGRLDVVHFLLQRGANPNIRNMAGMSPLMLAVAGGSPDMVEILIKKGADVNARTAGGVSALGFTSKLKKQNPEIIQLLTEAGAKE